MKHLFLIVLIFVILLPLRKDGECARIKCTDIIRKIITALDRSDAQYLGLIEGTPFRIRARQGGVVYEGTFLRLSDVTPSNGISIQVLEFRDNLGNIRRIRTDRLDNNLVSSGLPLLRRGDFFEVNDKFGDRISGRFIERVNSRNGDRIIFFETKTDSRREVRLSFLNESSLVRLRDAEGKVAPSGTGYIQNLLYPEHLNTTDSAVRDSLNSMGIRYRELDPLESAVPDQSNTRLESLLDYQLFYRKNNFPEEAVGYDLFGRTRLYEITPESLRNRISASANREQLDVALLHPELITYIRALNRDGYRLVVDSSLDLHGAMSAYFFVHNKIIAIRPSTPWHLFLHEFEHFKFQRLIIDRLGFENLQRFALSNDLNSALAMVEPPARRMLRHAFALARRGFSQVAVDETIAVAEEVRILREAGYDFMGFEVIRNKVYALDYQVASLGSIGNRTREQELMYRRVVTRRATLNTILENYRQTDTATRAGAASGAIGATAITAVYCREDGDSCVFKLSDDRWGAVSDERTLSLLSGADYQGL